MFRAEENVGGIASVLIDLAMVALDQGDEVRAGAELAESITLLQEQDERWQILLALEVCARWAALRGRRAVDAQAESERAARLFGAVEALRETLDAPAWPGQPEPLSAQCGQPAEPPRRDRVRGGWAEGRAMTLEQAVTEALDLLGDSAAEAAAPGAAGQADGSARPRTATRLTAREVAVLTWWRKARRIRRWRRGSGCGRAR